MSFGVTFFIRSTRHGSQRINLGASDLRGWTSVCFLFSSGFLTYRLAILRVLAAEAVLQSNLMLFESYLDRPVPLPSRPCALNGFRSGAD